MTPSFASAIRKHKDAHERKWLFYMNTPAKLELNKCRRIANEDNRKWAYIIVGRTQFLAVVDNKTMLAYKVDKDRVMTWYKWQQFRFVKFLSMMEF